MKFRVLILLSLLISTHCLAQKEHDVWFFGNRGGVTFASGSPVALPGSVLSTSEGSASVCDGAGNLQFYTDGLRVYNRNHVQMTNGNGLMGGSSSSQSAIILQLPGSTSIYYVFTVPDASSSSPMAYSIVDMTMSAGLGSVTATKNQPLLASCNEQLTYTHDANMIDYWVIAHQTNSNNFYAYKFSATGVNPVPVISASGQPTNSITANKIGYLKPNPCGDKLAMANWGLKWFQLHDFDNSTGVVSNGYTLGTFPGSNTVYGVEFSPQGSCLYCGTLSTPDVYQYDMSAGSSAAIAATQIKVGSSSGSSVGAIQGGPDGKLYVAKYGDTYLGCINNPDVVGLGCNYVDKAVLISGSCYFGLPNYTVGQFCNITVGPRANFNTANTTICQGSCITFNNTSTNSSIYTWSFPGGTPGSSTATTPTNICYNTPGQYDVQLIASDGTASDTMLIANYITVVAPPVAGTVTANPTIVCTGNTTQLSVTGSSGSIQWQSSTNGTTFTNIPGATSTTYSSPTLTQNIYYRVMASNVCGNDSSIVQLITVTPPPAAGTLSAVPTSLCPGNTSQLTLAGSSGNIQWEESPNGSTFTDVPGATNAAYTTPPLTATIYYRVTVSNSCSSTATTVQMITVLPGSLAGTLSSTRDTICENTLLTSTLTLNGSLGTPAWESSTDGINFTPMSVSGLTYTTPVLMTQTTYYRAVVASSVCPADTSPVEIVYIVPGPWADFTFTTNGLQATFVSTTAGGVVAYEWDYDDGTRGTVPNPAHTFAVAGNYDVCLTGFNKSNCTYTVCKTIYLEGVGIEEAMGNAEIGLYPNPAGDLLTVSGKRLTGNSELIIYNVLGQEVVTQTLNNTETTTLNIRHLATGTYVLMLRDADNVYVQKFLKK